MKFSPSLEKAIFLRRYKRFLADVRQGQETFTVHCPNTGSMTNCMAENQPCWLSKSDNAKRKYPYTWVLATGPSGDLIGVNSSFANALVEEALGNQVITELQGYPLLKREVRYGQEGSRVDFLLTGNEQDRRDCYVEVKSMTLMREPGLGEFPDAVSQRGRKHLRELVAMVEAGHRAVLLFCIQHQGIRRASIAADIDPSYQQALLDAMAAGVEVYAYRSELAPEQISLLESVPFTAASL